MGAKPRFGILSSGLQLGSILLLGLYLTNLAYGFQGSGTRLGQFQFVSHSLGGKDPGEPGNRFVHTALGCLPVPLPKDYVLGYDSQKRDFEDFQQPSYLRGEWRHRGWWYYYIYALMVKTSHGSQLLLIFTLISLTPLAGNLLFTSAPVCSSRRGARPMRDVAVSDLAVTAATPLLLLAVASAHLAINQHLRYVLPALGFALVLASGAAKLIVYGSPLPRMLAIAAVLWAVVSTARVYPHQLAYFNELAGGPKSGHRHLGGSNLDWGQDVLILRDWLRARHSQARVLCVVELPYEVCRISPRWRLLNDERVLDSALGRPFILVVSNNLLAIDKLFLSRGGNGQWATWRGKQRYLRDRCLRRSTPTHTYTVFEFNG